MNIKSELELSKSQFQKLSKLVYDTSGVVLNQKKYRLMVARITKRMRSNNLISFSDYIDKLASDQAEFSAFIDATTTNHTFFFRENKHCDFLVKHLDPKREIKVWSAASSSGEEPFSIAVQFMAKSFTFSIDGSDISETVLAQARKAIYPMDKVKQVPIPLLHTYFQKGKNRYEDHVRLKPQVRNKVLFKKFNLLSDMPSDRYDVIFCRNVMIYFDRPTRQKVVKLLCSALNPGGYLFVGLSESLHDLDHPLINIMASGYQKKE